MGKKIEADTFGKKLKKLREAEGMSVEELCGRVNLKPGYLARLERDEVLPPVAEILRLARALAVEPSTFMRDGKSASTRDQRDALEKRTRNYAYQTLTPDAHDKHLMAFLVTIDPESEHHQVGYRHEGEEFAYVISGKVVITVDKKKHKLGPGQSFHFDSGKNHQLMNPGKETTRLLVVIYTP